MSPKVVCLFFFIGFFISYTQVESLIVSDVINGIPGARTIVDITECLHTGRIFYLWDVHVPVYAHALQTVYEYIVTHLYTPARPCCLQGFVSDYTEAYREFVYYLPNIRRMEKRIQYSSPGCKLYLAKSMEDLKVVRPIAYPRHNTTHKQTSTTTTTTTTTTTPPSTTTGPTTLTTTTTTHATNSSAGIGCPTCDMNLNCVWNNVCGLTQSCLIRSYPGYPFATHCAEKGDCLLMKQLAPNGEIFCCTDEACIRKILGI